MKKTLLIMAAGLATRYGGNKQTEGFGPNGEMLMEYSIRDAKRSGFDKVVFVISPPMVGTFTEDIRSRVKDIEMQFAVQSFESLPEWFNVPDGRTRPYGTAHAILSARDCIKEPFAMINADDFYGAEAFADLAAEMDKMPEKNGACMVTYRLGNTLSGHGTVTRGICEVEEGVLRSITETYNVSRDRDGTVTGKAGDEISELSPDAPASMNIFGFTPWILDELAKEFDLFLHSEKAKAEKGELPVPIVLDKLIKDGRLSITARPTQAQWFGVTYKEDKELVRQCLRKLAAEE